MGIKSEIPFGSKYGKLLVVSEAEHQLRPNGKMKRMVNVVCDCGSNVTKSWQDIRSGKQKSCGLCKKEQPVKDISGLRVNRLLVTDTYTKSDGKVFWECLCDCGNTKSFDGVRLRNGTVYNCGSCGTKLGNYYIGDTFTNNEGYQATIIKIIDKTLYLKFNNQDETSPLVGVHYGNVKSGTFSNPYHKSVAGVGYYGVGRFVAKVNDLHTTEYQDWNSMIKRCYANYEVNKAYNDKTVCDEWHNFQNFAEWATSQQNFGKYGWDLEKDLLIKNNKEYSPQACLYLPREINSFIKRYRFNDLPLGVDIAHKYDGTPYYRVQSREDGKNICLGGFTDVESAFHAYKLHKEGLAKKLAAKWMNDIPRQAYDALMNYTVEITD